MGLSFVPQEKKRLHLDERSRKTSKWAPSSGDDDISESTLSLGLTSMFPPLARKSATRPAGELSGGPAPAWWPWAGR